MGQHRRPSQVIERVGRSMRQSSTDDWGGRLPAVPRTVSGTAGGTTGLSTEDGKKNEVHQITLLGVVDQDPGTPSGDLAFDQVATPPQGIVGFMVTQSEMAANGSVTEVECELTGTLLIDLEVLWADYADGGDVVVTRTSGTTVTTFMLPSGPIASPYFDDTAIAIDVYRGDRIKITVPG